MLLGSHNLIFRDFSSKWYLRWSKELKQTQKDKGKHALRANKFWQNAVMSELLCRRGLLKEGVRAIGFGVGEERLPALFAKYGVKVTATDQDFTKAKARSWNNDQLAHGVFSLNKESICPAAKFKKNVSFEPVDMTKISSKFYGKYDYLWSNCALGHLGTIAKGLGFIEESLKCLKPDGWAVHTTELNILSNTETLDNSTTVIFRLQDIYNLSKQLTMKGFVVNPFRFMHGRSDDDKRFTLRPNFGNDYSKILVGGHICTQIVIIVHSPKIRLNNIQKRLEIFKHWSVYRINLLVLRLSLYRNNELRQLFNIPPSIECKDIDIKPLKKSISLKGKKSGDVIIEYVNKSNMQLTGLFESLYNTKPIVLGTNDPINRKSSMATPDWFSENRPSISMVKKNTGEWQIADYVMPGEKFGFRLEYNITKGRSEMKSETFCIIREQDGIIPNSNVVVRY